jgi:hypothetical protein
VLPSIIIIIIPNPTNKSTQNFLFQKLCSTQRSNRNHGLIPKCGFSGEDYDVMCIDFISILLNRTRNMRTYVGVEV